MYHKSRLMLITFLYATLSLGVLCAPAAITHAEELQTEQSEIDTENSACVDADRHCIMEELRQNAQNISNEDWKNTTFRDLAITYAFEGNFDTAVEVMNNITNPDTRALTIRGIGMTLAQLSLGQDELSLKFTRLLHEAGQISHPPSNAIALTYIAMAQALSGDDEGAWRTAKAMNNPALRNKAYAETAEIQAEKGNLDTSMKSVEQIESVAFKNKALGTVSRILADKGEFLKAYRAARDITNPYIKTQSLQYILEKQKPGNIIFQ